VWKADRITIQVGFALTPIEAPWRAIGSVTDRREARRRVVLHITPWERDALQLLAEQKATAEIASCLGLSVSEIGPHLTALFEKMGAASRTEAIASARRRGLLVLDDERA
jgi:DNA-binding CsgD family transcriptional regulator